MVSLTRFTLLLVALCALAAPLRAQTASPALTARVQGIDSDETTGRKLQIESLDIVVRLRGTIAETTVTARFANPVDQILEGDFTLAMPAGSVVTGYALDVNGRMIDGVLVEQRRARMAYEARVRAGIDPGLAEVSRDNLFRTRVFPIFPRSGRTIRLQFTTPLDPESGYVMPLRDTAEIGAFSLRVEASGTGAPPALRMPGAGDPRWQASDGNQVFTLERRQAAFDGALEILAGAPAQAMLASRTARGETFFQIDDAVTRRSAQAAERPASVAILWDRSLSRGDDDRDAEIELLRQYLDRAAPGAIELILFDSDGVERRSIASAAALVRQLRSVR
jgi:hypothetical protein